MSFSVNRKASMLPASRPERNSPATPVLRIAFRRYEEDLDRAQYQIRPAHPEMVWLRTGGPVFDSMVAHFAIEPDGKERHGCTKASVTLRTCSYQKNSSTKKEKPVAMRDVEPEKIKTMPPEGADITLQLKNIFVPKLEEERKWNRFLWKWIIPW